MHLFSSLEYAQFRVSGGACVSLAAVVSVSVLRFV